MHLAEHESERHDEELITLVVVDMHDPVTPILQAEFAGEGLHQAGRMIARLSEVIHDGATVIEEHLPRGGTMEKYLSHIDLHRSGG